MKAIFCDCHDLDHVLVWEIEETELNENAVFKNLLVYYKLKHFGNFWRRLGIAFRYLFKLEVDKCEYLDIVISNREQLLELKEAIEDVINNSYPSDVSGSIPVSKTEGGGSIPPAGANKEII